jgi:hypothetical protein
MEIDVNAPDFLDLSGMLFKGVDLEDETNNANKKEDGCLKKVTIFAKIYVCLIHSFRLSHHAFHADAKKIPVIGKV